MFRQAKSAFIWYHLYKFRRTLVLVALLLSVVLFSQWIYSDVVEYLRLRDRLQYLDFILPIKWSIIFFNIGLSLYLILSLFKSDKDEKGEKSTETKKEKPLTKETKKKSSSDKKEVKKEAKAEKFTDREKMFLHKKNLKTKADSILNDK